MKWLRRSLGLRGSSGRPGREQIPDAGDVYLMPLEEGLFGACRVIRRGDPSRRDPRDYLHRFEYGVLVMATSWIGTSAPDLADPRLKEPLRTPFDEREGEIELIWVQDPLPDTFKYVGRVAPTQYELEEYNTKGSAAWGWLRRLVALKQNWDRNQDASRLEGETDDNQVFMDPYRLIEDYASEDDEVSTSAFSTLKGFANSRDARLLEPLRQAVCHRESRIRCLAAALLGRLGDQNVASGLIPLLEDKVWDVRYEAVEALGKLRLDSSIVPIIKCIEREENFRVRGLGLKVLDETFHCLDERIIGHLHASWRENGIDLSDHELGFDR